MLVFRKILRTYLMDDPTIKNTLLDWSIEANPFENTFAAITNLSKLHFRCNGFILLVQIKEVISQRYGSSKSC